MIFSLVQGDLEPAMEVDVTLNGAAVDISLALSVDLRWLRPDGTSSTVSLTVIDAVNGKTKRTWASGDSTVVGIHRGQVVVTWPSSRPQTFPNDYTHVLWQVKPALPAL